jgi:hypothetical protein
MEQPSQFMNNAQDCHRPCRHACPNRDLCDLYCHRLLSNTDSYVISEL